MQRCLIGHRSNSVTIRGLKTRSWEEVKPSLVNMIQAAKELRKILVKA